MKVPIFTGALGSTENCAKKELGTLCSGRSNLRHHTGMRENVCGIDPGLVLDSSKKIKQSPEMDRRITTIINTTMALVRSGTDEC